jgi:hypothetical protein
MMLCRDSTTFNANPTVNGKRPVISTIIVLSYDRPLDACDGAGLPNDPGTWFCPFVSIEGQ